MSHSYPSDISRGNSPGFWLESARRRTKPRTVDLTTFSAACCTS